MNPYDFVVAALATWYLSYIITAQSGPFSILEKMRERLGGLLLCIYCVAPYIAGIVYVVAQHESAGLPLVRIFGLAGGALMLRSYTGVGLHDV